jgi:hypothetical protein
MSKVSGTIDVSGDIQVNGMMRYSVFTQSSSSSDDIYLDKVHTINITHSVRVLLPDLSLSKYKGVTYSISKNTTESIRLVTQSNNTIYYDGEYKELHIIGGTNVLNLMNINGHWTLTATNEIPIAQVNTNRNMILMGKGSKHTIGVSHDGENIRLMGKDIFTIAGHGVTHNTKGVWVGFGCGTNTIAYTTDNGNTWVPLGTSVFSINCFDVSYDISTGMWVAVGEGVNSIAYSHDGITWVGLGTSVFQTYGIGVHSNNGRWVACGTGSNTVAYSIDGKTWVGLGSILSSRGNCVGFHDGLWFVGGDGSENVKWSSDTLVWSAVPPGMSPSLNDTQTSINSILDSVRCMTFGIDKWVAVGEGASHTVAYSHDGVSWTGLGKALFSVKGAGVYYSYIHFMWFAFGEGTHTSIKSHNGLDWVTHGDVFDISGFSMSTRCQHQSIPGEVHVAIGKGVHTICCSTDGGLTYTGVGSDVFTTQGFGIHYHDGMWVATGEGRNTLAYSYHGCIWKGVGDSMFTTRGRCVTHFKDKWVAVGQGVNTLAYSNDGVSWHPLGSGVITNSGLHVDSSDTVCVAVGIGENKLAYSFNGIDWHAVPNTFQSFGSYVYHHPGTQTWYAFGDDTVIFTSSNGVQWSKSTSQLPADMCVLQDDGATGELTYLHDKKWNAFSFLT